MTDITDVQGVIESATDEIADGYDADNVDVHGNGFRVQWDNEAKTIENVHNMIRELERVGEQYPDAEINSQANRDGYSVSVWLPEDEEADEDTATEKNL